MTTTSVSLALDRFTTFGDLLRYLRRRSGLTQRELSIAVGYSDTQISRLEQNERLPDLATLTARFLPALHVEDQPEVAARLLELAASVSRADAPAVGLPPYKGLRYFGENDAELFFGRETLTDRLLSRVTVQLKADLRFLAVIGASGSGKSSLVRAGLVPALRWRQPSSGWPILILTPTAHPLEALAACLSRDAQHSQPLRRLADELERDPECLARSLAGIAHAESVDQAVLVVDQFEELFTLCRSQAEQHAFIDNLMTAASLPEGLALVMIVLRADFYAHCARFNALRSAVSQAQEYIGPMTSDELRRAIAEPARAGHWELEPGLVELLLHDVGADVGHVPEPGALPLLSHALLETWGRRRGRTLTLSGYTATGGVRGAIAETAEAVYYDQLEPNQRQIARQIFLRLTELGGDSSTADTRRRVSFNELVTHPEEAELVQGVLLTLADARLITTEQETAEVAHEALIREWPTLRGWLEENREALRLHRRLTEASQEWDALGRDPESLYRGLRLAQVQEWASEYSQDINPLERAFVEASEALAAEELLAREAQMQRELQAAQHLAESERRRAEDQVRANQRIQRRAIGLVVALVVAGALALSSLLFWQRAASANHLANARELAAASVSNLQVDPERSVLLALHALQESPILEARNALHQAIPALHIIKTIPAHTGGAVDVAYSPDGRRIATMGIYGDVRLWDAATGEPIDNLIAAVDDFGNSMAYSPDGRTLAVSFRAYVQLFDAHSGALTGTITGEGLVSEIGYNLGVGQICFSPDGRRLALANLDTTTQVWDLKAMQPVLSIAGGDFANIAIACSPDGAFLANAGQEGIVRVWDAFDGMPVYQLDLGGFIHSLSFSPDGARLVAGSEDGRVRVWDMATGEVLVKLPRISGMYDITFLADGAFVTAGQDGTAHVWDSLSGEELLTLAGPTSTIIGVAGSPRGGRIATSAYDGSLRIWDATPGRELATIQAHDEVIWNVAYSPDGRRIASAGADGFARVWDTQTNQLLLSLTSDIENPIPFTGLAYSPDGLRLATGGVDGRIVIWDSQSGDRLAELAGHANMVVGLAFSPDGRWLASSAWLAGAKVWDLERNALMTAFTGHPETAFITNIAFSLDGDSIFTAGDDQMVYQWEAATGQVLRSFTVEGKELYGVAVSPDGGLLAVSDQDGNIILWNLDTGEKINTLTGHAGLAARVVFNHDGSLLASASHDRLAKVWDVKSGEETASLYGNTSNVYGVAFSPDGQRLVTAGADGTLRIYTLDLDRLVDLARERLMRTLTQEECRKFLHLEACP
jgi:WD40 repeat protein/DNA-binding XRE family transcriptional regulator